jgi:hypothetical protein
VDGHPWIDSSDLVFLHFLHYPWQQQVHNLNLFSNFSGRTSFFFVFFASNFCIFWPKYPKAPTCWREAAAAREEDRMYMQFSIIIIIIIMKQQKNNKSSSSGAQHVTLQKIFLTSKFSYLLFSNPTHKTKTGTANRWETTNSNLPRPIIMIGLSEIGSSSQSSLAGVQNCRAKTILLTQASMF